METELSTPVFRRQENRYVMGLIEITTSFLDPGSSAEKRVKMQLLKSTVSQYETFLSYSVTSQFTHAIIINIYRFLTSEERGTSGLTVCKQFYHGLKSPLASEFWISSAKDDIVLPKTELGWPSSDPPLVYGSQMCVPYGCSQYAVCDPDCKGLKTKVVQHLELQGDSELRAWNGSASLWVQKVPQSLILTQTPVATYCLRNHSGQGRWSRDW